MNTGFSHHSTKRLVVAVTGASGMPLALTLLRALAGLPVVTHLVISQAAQRVLMLESGLSVADFIPLADTIYRSDDFSAPPASGSWPHDGMIICPCSMSTLGHIAQGSGVNLIHRAADVTLKERRKLVLVTRETPLSVIHLRNMLAATEAGAVVFPPCPAFYNKPESLEQVLEHTAGRILDSMGMAHNLGRRWGETPETPV